jgi:hypothetical protein
VLAPSTPFQTFLHAAHSAVSRGAAVVWPAVYPAVSRAGTALSDALSDSPDVVFVGFALAIAFLVLQVFLWVHRVMMFWTRLVTRLVFWSLAAMFVAMVWQRGPEAVLRDLASVAGSAVAYATVVKNIWLAEYDRYDAQTRNSRQTMMGANASGRTGRNARY